MIAKVSKEKFKTAKKILTDDPYFDYKVEDNILMLILKNHDLGKWLLLRDVYLSVVEDMISIDKAKKIYNF